jgi:hypothetical protein
MTAIRIPWFSVRIRLSKVVFPEPKKPVMTVTGIGPNAFSSCSIDLSSLVDNDTH